MTEDEMARWHHQLNGHEGREREEEREEGEAGVGKSIRLAQCLKHLGIQVIVNGIHHYQ